jgi:hypothetical protein
MEPSNLHVLVEAKTEYTKTLISILTPRLREGIFSIFQESLNHCRDTNTTNQLLVTFQKYLSSIPRWSDYMIEEEFERIQRLSKCDYIEDLITAVFVSHTKILTSIRSGSKIKKIDLTIPKPQTFVHKAYIECARLFWKQPYVFILSTKYSEDMEISKIKQQQNYRECEKIIEEALNETIRRMLPVKSILSTYLGESVNDLMSNEDDIEDDGLNHNIVRSLVEKELEKHKREQSQLDEPSTQEGGNNSRTEAEAKTEANPESENGDNEEEAGGGEETKEPETKETEHEETRDNTGTQENEISILEPAKLQEETPTDTPQTQDENINLDGIADLGDITSLDDQTEITLDLNNIPDVTLSPEVEAHSPGEHASEAHSPGEPTPEASNNSQDIPNLQTQDGETGGDIGNIGQVLRDIKVEVERERETTPDAEIPSNENITFHPGVPDNEGKTEMMMELRGDDEDEDDDDRQIFRMEDDTAEDINIGSLDGIMDLNSGQEQQQQQNDEGPQEIDIDSIPML